ncbi:MAG: helix-turn-helix domain-containing protein [Candidatus Bathyarchaeia archaeon]
MPKGKPWTVEEERALKRLREEGKTVAEIASRLGKSPEAVKMKLSRLGLKVVTLRNQGVTTSELIVPEELISVEEALKELVAAMNALKQPGLSKTEIMRLKALIQTSNLYQKRIAEYIDYRGLERELCELRDKYEALVKQLQK